jgi:hypothetical protein
MRTPAFGLAIALAAAADPIAAQTPAAGTRPASTTVSGDTGLWFVPTGEILPARKWSSSGYRVNAEYETGFTDVSNWPLTWAVGVRNRLELFGAQTVVNRIDRDVRPLALDTPGSGIVNEYPFASAGWTGSHIGDLWLGAKVGVTSQLRQASAAFALRAMAKIPVSGDTAASTGRPDVAVDAIVSREVNQRIELSAFAGFIARGDPAAFDLVNGVRWGGGAGLPTRKYLRVTTELYGEVYTNGTIVSRQGSSYPQKGPVNAAVGLTWLGRRGMFVGAGLTWNLRMRSRSEIGGFTDRTGDALGLQARIGFHPGVFGRRQ